MDIEIKRTVNGFHVKDTETGDDMCFEGQDSLMTFLCKYLPENTDGEIRITD